MDNASLTQTLETAFTLQQTGNIDQAMQLFRDILMQWPNQADALHGMGLCYAQKKEIHQAIKFFHEALAQSPHVPAFHNNLGNAYKLNRQLDLARRHYLEALRLKSPYPEAHNNLGSIYYLKGQYMLATEQFQKALRINPNSWDAHFNLANCYLKRDLYLEAKPHFEAVLKFRPDHIGAINNLGIIFCLLKQFDAAKPLLMQVIAREPYNTDALFYLGIANASTEALDAAKENYKALLTINPHHDRAHHNLATLFLHLENRSNALEHYQEAYKLNPQNKTAHHMIKALCGETLEEGAPPDYTRALFDQYAYSYNQHVKEKLHYQVPNLLRSLIQPYVMHKNTAWQVLDLGCGTGLCAPYFIDIADKLYGVDLSPNMVDQATKLNAYYRLAVEDINDFLIKTKQTFDLIIAADVFVYFGDLSKTFKNCYAALNNQGYFLFSIEDYKEKVTNKPYHLNPTGRYQHQSEYLRELIDQSDFSLCTSQTATIRQQNGSDVIGQLYLLKK